MSSNAMRETIDIAPRDRSSDESIDLAGGKGDDEDDHLPPHEYIKLPPRRSIVKSTGAERARTS